MTKEELLTRLRELALVAGEETEAAHSGADSALLEFIADEEVQAAYESIRPKWYA